MSPAGLGTAGLGGLGPAAAYSHRGSAGAAEAAAEPGQKEAAAGPAAAVILDHTNSIYIIRKAEEETDVSRETSERDEASRTSQAAARSTGGAFVRRKPPAGAHRVCGR